MKRHDENAELDAFLQSESQQRIQQAVRSIPEDSLSLAWRSNLNERLRKAQPIPRWRLRFAATWRPALAVALTGCLATILMVQTSPIGSQSSSDLEESLVSVHFDAAASEELTGSGLAFYEVNDTTQASETSAEVSEPEFGSL